MLAVTRNISERFSKATNLRLWHELTGLEDGLLREGVHSDGLVALGVDEVVVQDLDASVLGRQQRNLVGHSLSISEGGNVLADIAEAHHDLLGVGTGQLSLGLLPENDDIGVGVLLQDTARSLGQTRVDTTAETLVRTGDNNQGLLVLERLGFGVLKNGVGGTTVDSRLVHGLLGPSKTSRSNNLHGVGDLLDVLNGFETALNFTQGREVGGIGGRSAVKQPSAILILIHTLITLFPIAIPSPSRLFNV